MERTAVMAEFSLEGVNLPPEVVTEKLGLEPTTIWRKGDVSKLSRKRYLVSRWQFGTGYMESLAVEDQLRKLIDVFGSKVETINQLSKEWEAEVFVNIAIEIEDKESPSVYLDRETIEFIHKSGAVVDIDIIVV